MIQLTGSDVPEQTARMRRLIRAFGVRVCSKTRFRIAYPYVHIIICMLRLFFVCLSLSRPSSAIFPLLSQPAVWVLKRFSVPLCVFSDSLILCQILLCCLTCLCSLSIKLTLLFDIFRKVVFCLALYRQVNLQTFAMI